MQARARDPNRFVTSTGTGEARHSLTDSRESGTPVICTFFKQQRDSASSEQGLDAASILQGQWYWYWDRQQRKYRHVEVVNVDRTHYPCSFEVRFENGTVRGTEAERLSLMSCKFGDSCKNQHPAQAKTASVLQQPAQTASAGKGKGNKGNSSIAEFKENSGSMHQERAKLTADRLRAAGISGRRPTRDDDESSVASMASTFSNVSVQPSAHARQQASKRCIIDPEVQEAKKNGCISLAICSGNDLDMTRGDIWRWGTSLVEAFDGVSLGEPELRGSAKDRRFELVLAGSERKGERIKQWLKDEGYFQQYSKRMLYAWRQRDRELVVVEGRVQSGDVMLHVGIITTFRRDKATNAKTNERY